MNKDITLRIQDNGGSVLRASLLDIPEEQVYDICLTILNKTILVTDAWGYCDYDVSYDSICEEAKTLPIEHGNSILCVEIGVDTKLYKNSHRDIESFMAEVDEFLLAGFDYDPEVEPYDMNVVLPKLTSARHIIEE